MYGGLRFEARVARCHESRPEFLRAFDPVNGTPVTLPLELAEFAKVYDGTPTDQKTFDELQITIEREVRERATKKQGQN